jgi:hypothetical protein
MAYPFRPYADTVGCAVTVMRIATGEIEETDYRQPSKRKGGLAGGKARANKLTSEKRSEIARRGAAARLGIVQFQGN